MRVAMNSERVRRLREERGMTNRALAAAAVIPSTRPSSQSTAKPFSLQGTKAGKEAKALGVRPSRELGRPLD